MVEVMLEAKMAESLQLEVYALRMVGYIGEEEAQIKLAAEEAQGEVQEDIIRMKINMDGREMLEEKMVEMVKMEY